MRTYFVSILLIISTSYLSWAQSPIRYSIDMSNKHHHELRIEMQVDGLTGERAVIQMPNASPGRYAAHEFAKNVYDEKAMSGEGQQLVLKKLDAYSWEAEIKDGSLIFSYTLFGNHADGTYVGIDAKKLHLNMPASFVYIKNQEERPVELLIDLSDEPTWDVATQLQETSSNMFSAPNYAYFFDSPTLVGEIDWRRWKVGDQTIEMAVMHEGTDEELDAYTEWVKKIVDEQRRVFGELPNFDFGRYTFLISYNPWVHGDGMEHRNSTVCTSQGNLANHAKQLIGTISHEFFHAWNVERIRPASLEPFDYDRPNISEALWFGEGFTSYYDDLILARAGILAPEQYIKSIIGTLNYVLNSPGRTIRNPMQMSQNAPFVDAGTANDETNYINNYISYYSYGAVLGLGLDLSLRTSFKNVTLDTFMKAFWEKYGKTAQPYTMKDLETTLGDITNNSFASAFFENQIEGSTLPDFEALFQQFGINVSLQSPNSAYFNNPKINKEGIITSSMVKGTALYDAGVEKGDRLISVNNYEIEYTADLNHVINQLEVGKTYSVKYEQLGEVKEGTFEAKQDPRITLSYLPEKNLKKDQIKMREKWLNLE